MELRNGSLGDPSGARRNRALRPVGPFGERLVRVLFGCLLASGAGGFLPDRSDAGPEATPPAAADPAASPARTAALPAPQPDVDVFMQIGAAAGPILSPDGRTLLFQSAGSGTNQIYRLLPEGWPYQLTVLPEGVDNIVYSPDCGSAVIGVDSGGNERMQLELMDARTGAIRPLTADPKTRFASAMWSPDGHTLYYSANAADPASFYIYRMDVSTCATTLVLERKGANVAVDLSPDGGRLIVNSTTSSLDNNLYVLDLMTGALDLITPHEGEHSFGGGAFSADGKSVYITTDDDPEGRLRLARIDLASGKRTFVLTNDSPWDLENFTLSDNRRFLAWVMNEDGYGRLHLQDLEEDRALPVPDLRGIISSPVVVNAGYLAFAYNSPTQTSDIWIWDFRAAAGLDESGPSVYSAGVARSRLADPQKSAAAPNPVRVTFSSYAGVDPSVFHEPELIRYRSFDGTEIPAFLYLPPGYSGGPIPFIVEAHGGPSGQFRPFFNRHFQYLMQNGFGILAPNFRGSSGYGRAFEDADNYRKRLDSVRDVAAGAQWLIDRKYACKGQIGIKGASYGGFMTLAAMTGYPDLFAAGLDQVGIGNFETFLARTAEYRRSLRESEYGPASDPEFLKTISPLYKADRIRGALFVVHGENDPRVPVSEARQILAAVRGNGTPVDSLIFPDEGHGIVKRENRLVFYSRMAAFFKQYLSERKPVP